MPYCKCLNNKKANKYGVSNITWITGGGDSHTGENRHYYSADFITYTNGVASSPTTFYFCYYYDDVDAHATITICNNPSS